MRSTTKPSFLLRSVLIFTGLPLLLLMLGNYPERTMLKECLSFLTILAFFQMIGQFFWSQGNRSAVKKLTMSKVIKYHKIIGYIFVIVLIIHPVLLVVPRFFESGVNPVDAFLTIITTLTRRGVILGIIAWCLLLTIAVTSLTRKKLPMKYTTWRVFHGILAMLFVFIATWHVIDLGRHATPVMSAFIIMLSAGGVLLLLQNYLKINYCAQRTKSFKSGVIDSFHQHAEKAQKI